MDLAQPCSLCLEQLKLSALYRHLHEFQAAAGRPDASKLAHYLAAAWGGQLPGAEEYQEYVPLPAAVAPAVPSPAAQGVALVSRGDGEVRTCTLCAAYLAPVPGRARGCAARSDCVSFIPANVCKSPRSGA
jgi:hypothetical protein